mmetsp:Transcript_1498/g.4337  ORF Transcript_1498/g.4337 Transcript_1498/m.4337 type:complete len:427 (-) Transcript_1498:266-1546(-)
MDHLQNDEERKARWYATHLRPRYIEVRRSADAASLRVTNLDDGYVAGIPSSLFSSDATQVDANEATQLLHEHLEEYGFAVVTGALSESECSAAIGLAWDYLEAASKVEREIQEDATTSSDPPPVISRDDPTTLSSQCYPAQVEGGILPFYGSGHTKFSWYLRDRKIVQTIYASLYNTVDLITSLDGLVIWRAGDDHKTDAGWFHLDQNPKTKPGFEAVQGLLNLLPVSSSTGGNVVVSKSHRLFPHHYAGSFVEQDGTSACSSFYRQRLNELKGDDWMEIDPNDSRLLDPSNIISCLLDPGDLILWDSRTVHCSFPGNNCSSEDKHSTTCSDNTSYRGLIRVGGLVSMMPKSRATDEVIRGRIEAVKSSRTLTHWANKCSPLGEEHEEEASLELRRVELMNKLGSKNDRVLLGWSDLTPSQKDLVR